MRSRIIVIALMALLTGRNEVLAQTDAASPPAQANPNNEAPSTPEHTGWATLARDTAHDFVAFPRRKSTWTLLGVGAAAALATHPADHYVERHVVGNDTAENVFRLGRWVGSAGVEFGGAVGVWAVGRYIVAPATDAPRTNKMSHLGFDLIRAQILSQALGSRGEVLRPARSTEWRLLCLSFWSLSVSICRRSRTRTSSRIP